MHITATYVSYGHAREREREKRNTNTKCGSSKYMLEKFREFQEAAGATVCPAPISPTSRGEEGTTPTVSKAEAQLQTLPTCEKAYRSWWRSHSTGRKQRSQEGPGGEDVRTRGRCWSAKLWALDTNRESLNSSQTSDTEVKCDCCLTHVLVRGMLWDVFLIVSAH